MQEGLVGEPQRDELLLAALSLEDPQPRKPRDAVGHVHHQVAMVQVRQRFDRPARADAPNAAPVGVAVEDLVVADDDQRFVGPVEAAPHVADGRADSAVTGDLVLAEQLDEPLLLGGVLAVDPHVGDGRQLVQLGERLRHVGRQALQRSNAQVQRAGPALGPEAVHRDTTETLERLEHRARLGQPYAGRLDRCLGARAGPIVKLHRQLGDIGRLVDADDGVRRQVIQQAPGPGDIAADRQAGQVHPVDLVAGAGRVQVEVADRLDGIAEKLHADSLPGPGREDVDDPAAAGELALLVDLVDRFVAGRHQPLGQAVHAQLAAGLDRQPPGGQGIGRGDGLEQRHHRRDDEPQRLLAGRRVGQQVADARSLGGDLVADVVGGDIGLPGREKPRQLARDDLDVVGQLVGVIEVPRHKQHRRIGQPPHRRRQQRRRRSPHAGQLHHPPRGQPLDGLAKLRIVQYPFEHGSVVIRTLDVLASFFFSARSIRPERFQKIARANYVHP